MFGILMMILLGVIITIIVAGYRFYNIMREWKHTEVLGLTKDISYHIEEILYNYPLLANNFEKEQEIGNEPRFGWVWLQLAELINMRNKEYVKEFADSGDEIINTYDNFDININCDMDCIKSRTNYIEYESIQLLNIENIVTKIRHHITTIGYKRDELEELKNQRILIFFK